MNARKKKLDNRRYKLHYHIKRKEPADYKILNTRKRTFSVMPVSERAKTLVNEFQYSVQTSIPT